MTNSIHAAGAPDLDARGATAVPDRPSIDVRGLRKTYGKLAALDGLDLTLHAGGVIGLLGQNGCGKTTLLKVLAGVLQDYEGQVRIAGHAPGPRSKARVSFLPDESFLPDSATVGHCLRIYGDFFADFDDAKARRMLADFGLPQDMKLRAMSKGMREKAQIALAMSRRAEVYLLDEPISGVDPAAREVLLSAIASNLEPDSIVLISTHLVHDLEPMLDAAVIMRAGRVLLAGDLDDLRAQYGTSLDGLFRELHR